MNIYQLSNKYREFQRYMSGKDPQAVLNSLIKEGKVTQEQINNFSSMAQMIQNFAKLK